MPIITSTGPATAPAQRPVNATGLLGRLLGHVVNLDSPRVGPDAHSIALTAFELSPRGRFTSLGASDPFSV